MNPSLTEDGGIAPLGGLDPYGNTLIAALAFFVKGTSCRIPLVSAAAQKTHPTSRGLK